MSSWVEYSIDELMNVQNGYAFKSGEYIEEGPNTFEVLKMGHIEKGGGLRKSPKKDYVPRTEKLERWVLSKDDIVMFYEYLLLKSVGLGGMNSDSAVPGLNRNAAHAIPVTIPPSELVESFNDFCKSTFAKINTNIRQIRPLETLRDTLLPKLMSGEVRVAA